MLVTGGTYFESCSIPDYTQLYGSGLRGVAAISNLIETTNELRTCIAAEDTKRIDPYTSVTVYDFEYGATIIPTTVRFDYFHSLSTPTYSPRDAVEYDKQLGPFEHETILRYGMVEGTAVVKGDTVVYDPQSADPDPFHGNGSEADHLGIVLNQYEGRALTGGQTYNEILGALTTDPHGADVAVLKCGPTGTLVRSNGTTHEIPVFQLNTFWPIGSGDVFTAVFAAYWADHGLPPKDAAYEAALATAYYCNTQVLPVPPDPLEVEDFNPIEKPPTFDGDDSTVYLAGPFFSIPQLWFVTEVRRLLHHRGATVFSPYHDVGHINSGQQSDQDVAQADLDAIDDSDIIFALTDNLDPGTYFELGYARNADIPVIVYQHEPARRRQTMLTGSGCDIYDDLASAVHNVLLEPR